MSKFKILLLKVLTKLQEKSVKGNGWWYLLWSKMHFKLFFGKDLEETLLNEPKSKESRMFLERHSNMVISVVYNSEISGTQAWLPNVIKTSFIFNLMARQRI